MFKEDIGDLFDAFKEQAQRDKWTIEDWLETLSVLIDPHYKGKYHPRILTQMICEQFTSLNDGQFRFKTLRTRQTQLKKTLSKLREIPLGKAQKSEEWNRYRHDHINASEANSVFTGSVNSLMYKKAAPYEEGGSGGTLALQHGNRFEPIAFAIRSAKSGKTIYEFESIQHPTYHFLAASPDGIDEDGTLVEIKNPRTREIIGAPKPEYWVQTQLQMEVCDLDMCDFVECKIDEYPCLEDYLDDTDYEWRGIILEYRLDETDPKWVYSPLNLPVDEMDEWITTQKEQITAQNPLDNEGNPTYVEVIPWRLDVYSEFRVYRDRVWFADALPKFVEFWENVLTHRRDETWETIPVKRRTVTQKKQEFNTTKVETCLLDDE